MPRRKNKLLIVDVAALGWDLVVKHRADAFIFRKMDTVFPAVTCPVQASFRTASAPSEHGIVSNGLYSSSFKKILFWEQSANLVCGPRIWQRFRKEGKRVGMMFWQQSMGESADLLLSPAPIHKHHGGMIQDCYGRPRDLYPRLVKDTGRAFNLMNYWGPFAGPKSSEWITAALEQVMRSEKLSPDLLFGYIPDLDYDLQRHGPHSAAAAKAVKRVMNYLIRLRDTADEMGYQFLFFGDYSIEPATGGAVFPNRQLRGSKLMRVRKVKGREYPDLYRSRAFTMVDHQVAHVYVPHPKHISGVTSVLTDLPGIAHIYHGEELKEIGLSHPRTGQLVLVASPGYWFAYPWWTGNRQAPDYATHVDIHNKPGYDPCELFFHWLPPGASQDTTKVRGTHGRTGPGTEVAWTCSPGLVEDPTNTIELAAAVRHWLSTPK